MSISGRMIWWGWYCLWGVVVVGCNRPQAKNGQKTQDSVTVSTLADSVEVKPPTCDSLRRMQTIKVAGHLVDIAVPQDSTNIKANLLVLQGWNFPKDDWCKKSSLCKKALSQGYRLIMPEMGKSTYSSKLYPETLKQWRKYPTLKWVTDSLIPYLQQRYCIMTPHQANFVVGLSTGARGAGLVVLNLPGLFKAVAALSGDFDQRKIPYDRIMTGFYGSIATFPKRWAGEDNMVVNIQKFKTPFYLGHGKLDRVCPPAQTQLFYQTLKKAHPRLKVVLSMPTWAAHNYRYWDYEVDKFLKFFEAYR
ncbi:prolyl oligopeptidase family serine peptidase [Microscilla marina]|nr:prolyl oligopeptidase family serine peptidase [Microscilla marina]